MLPLVLAGVLAGAPTPADAGGVPGPAGAMPRAVDATPAAPGGRAAACPEVAFAQGVPGTCEGVKPSRHGWLGVLRSADGYALGSLTSRESDDGDPTNGLCAVEESVGGLAVRGGGFAPRPLVAATLEGDSDCRLPRAKVTLGGVAWSVSVSEQGVLRLSGPRGSVEYALGSACWTSLLVAHLDGDALPDVVVERDGGGIVTVLGLSRAARGKGPVSPCATLARPPC